MSNSNKFWKGMLWGALAGGFLSLLDRETRLTMKESCVKGYKSVTKIVKNPEEITNQVKETAQKWKTTVEEVGEDIAFITSKVEELRETTPKVTKMLKETKNTFAKVEEDIDLTDKDESL